MRRCTASSSSGGLGGDPLLSATTPLPATFEREDAPATSPTSPLEREDAPATSPTSPLEREDAPSRAGADAPLLATSPTPPLEREDAPATCPTSPLEREDAPSRAGADAPLPATSPTPPLEREDTPFVAAAARPLRVDGPPSSHNNPASLPWGRLARRCRRANASSSSSILSVSSLRSVYVWISPTFSSSARVLRTSIRSRHASSVVRTDGSSEKKASRVGLWCAVHRANAASSAFVAPGPMRFHAMRMTTSAASSSRLMIPSGPSGRRPATACVSHRQRSNVVPWGRSRSFTRLIAIAVRSRAARTSFADARMSRYPPSRCTGTFYPR